RQHHGGVLRLPGRRCLLSRRGVVAMPELRLYVVRIDASGILFLVMVCLLVPYAAIQSNRRLGDRPLPFSRTRLFVQTIIVQLWLFGLAVLAAVRNHVDLFVAPKRPLLAWGLAVLLLAVL